ncbi:MAG: phosphoglucosamine mutase [Armatimonadetes bacterium]|nr:phosphoglucosamine mutase [Armatimonadota bacterium]
MASLKISITGVRGIVGETLDPRLLTNFAQAFGTLVGPATVLISRDTRPSGPMVTSCVAAGLLATGCRVVELGVCPTPAMQWAVKSTEAGGGIAVTAGHNALEWNALKFVRQDGLYLNANQGEELLNILHQGEFHKAPYREVCPAVETEALLPQEHARVLRRHIDAKAIRKAAFTVAVDCCNGACSGFTPGFLGSLGCRVVPINTDTDQPFPHEPAPGPKNLGQLRALVAAAKADVGFAQDADGDRLGVVTEKGEAPGDELTLCLATEAVLSRGDPGPVVTNVSTTHAVDEVAERHGREVIRTRVGQSFVAEAALSNEAAVAGEGSGGVMFPRINCAHDSLATLAHVLELMAHVGRPLSSIVAELPSIHMVKLTIPCPPAKVSAVVEQIREEAEQGVFGGAIDLEDGVKIIDEGMWVHVRASITEPIIRVISEGPTQQAANDLAERFAWRVRRAVM